MMTVSSKVSHSGLSKPFVALISSVATLMVFTIFFSNPFNPAHSLSQSAPLPPLPNPVEQPSLRQPMNHCPVLLYNKQIKTGSTIISNVIYRTTEAYGCRNAPCDMHQLLMGGATKHIGTHNGLSLSCHAREYNKDLIRFLRATHGNNFIFVASVREPLSWFKSSACFFYNQQHAELHIRGSYNDSIYKDAIDWLLQADIFKNYETFLFHSLGLQPNSTGKEMFEKFLAFDIIIDNKEIKEGLAELGAMLGWKMLEPTAAKAVTYRGPLYDTYRMDEIISRTRRLGALYEKATLVRNLRKSRPKFAPDEAQPVDAAARMQVTTHSSRIYQSNKKQ